MANLLQELKRHNKMELKNLSTQLHVSTSSLCILLNKLVEKKYVYREEDLGLDGLREAKLSYHPCKFIEKYSIKEA